MGDSALKTFLEQNGIKPTNNKKENMKLARPLFTTYKQYKEKSEK